MTNKRNVDRLTVDQLPESLKAFTVSFDSSDAILVETCDAGNNGLGIIAHDYLDKFNLHDQIILNSLDKTFSITAVIIYLYIISDHEIKIGLQIKKTQSLTIFHQQLKDLIRHFR